LQNYAILYQKKQEKTKKQRFLREKSIKKHGFFIIFHQKQQKTCPFNSKNALENHVFWPDHAYFDPFGTQKITVNNIKVCHPERSEGPIRHSLKHCGNRPPV